MKKKTLGDKIRDCLGKAYQKNSNSFFSISDNEVGKTEFNCFWKENGEFHLILGFPKAKYELKTPEGGNAFSSKDIESFIEKAEEAKRKILQDDEKLRQFGFQRVKNSLDEYRMELQVPFLKDVIGINITRTWNHSTSDTAFSRWELGGRLMGSGYSGKDVFSLLNETFNKIKEQMNEEIYLGLPENLRDYLICGEEENIWNWTAA